VQLDPIKLTLKAPRSKRLKPKCDELLSNVVFNVNVRRYTKERSLALRLAATEEKGQQALMELAAALEVGRCRLTLSASVLKAPVVSALETKI
jgi:hypothetical protein